MDEVGNNEDIVLLEYSVSGSMSVCRNALHATFECVASLEQVQMSLVGFEHALCQLALVAFHGDPCLRFHTIDIHLGIREHYFPFLQQTAYVVGMKMSDVYQLQFFGSHSLLLQFRKQLTERSTKSCVEQYRFPFCLKQQATHA